TFTAGQIDARLAHLPGAEMRFRRGLVARSHAELFAGAGLDADAAPSETTVQTAEEVASALRRQSRASHALAVIVDLDEGADRLDLGGSIHIGIAFDRGAVSRRARILGGRDWVRLGAVELGLDCLRRHLLGLPVSERIDFEKV
ncbi:MAG: CinA family protein, partial [Variibacter sp.]|nr:CinA family protein [Variibacter sp.]